METFVSESELARALEEAHHLQERLLQARIERLTALLREHGIPLPEEDPRLGASDGEHLARCRAVVSTAYGLLTEVDRFEKALTDLRTMVGPGMELVRKETWR